MADNIDLLAGKIVELADALAQPAATAALEAARMEAFSALAGGAQAIGFAVLLGFATRWLWRIDGDDELLFLPKLGGALLGAAAIICLSVGLWAVIDPRTWVTIQHPELWLAKRMLGL